MLQKKGFFRIILMVSFLVWVGCSPSKNGAPSQRMDKETAILQKIYVDNISCNTSISAGQDLQVTVSGNLPSPAYTFEKFDVEVKGKVIEITPWAKYDANKIVTQIIIPFEQVCTVQDLQPGTYDVKVNTRTEPVVKKELVRVGE